MIEATFKGLPYDIRQMYHLKKVQGSDYIPSLYQNSGFKFDPESDRLEKSIEQFTSKSKSTQPPSDKNIWNQTLQLVQRSTYFFGQLQLKY